MQAVEIIMVALMTLPISADVELLKRADGKTDHEAVAAAVHALRVQGPMAAPAAETLSALLRHQSRLYTDRDKVLVVRLRSFIVAALSDIGVPDSAAPMLIDTLGHIDERMAPIEAGAAARAAGSLGSRGAPFVPYLVDLLSLERFAAEEFSLERYEPWYPQEEATTVRLEAVRALGRICSAQDREALNALVPLTGDSDARVARAAQQAVKLISNRGPRS